MSGRPHAFEVPAPKKVHTCLERVASFALSQRQIVRGRAWPYLHQFLEGVSRLDQVSQLRGVIRYNLFDREAFFKSLYLP